MVERIAHKLRQGVGKIDGQQTVEIVGLVGVFLFMYLAMMPLY